jgi:hypothetical protein
MAMKKLIVGFVAAGAAIGLLAGAKRMSEEMRKHSAQMAAHCKQMAAHRKQMAAQAEKDREPVGTI